MENATVFSSFHSSFRICLSLHVWLFGSLPPTYRVLTTLCFNSPFWRSVDVVRSRLPTSQLKHSPSDRRRLAVRYPTVSPQNRRVAPLTPIRRHQRVNSCLLFDAQAAHALIGRAHRRVHIDLNRAVGFIDKPVSRGSGRWWSLSADCTITYPKRFASRRSPSKDRLGPTERPRARCLQVRGSCPGAADEKTIPFLTPST